MKFVRVQGSSCGVFCGGAVLWLLPDMHALPFVCRSQSTVVHASVTWLQDCGAGCEPDSMALNGGNSRRMRAARMSMPRSSGDLHMGVSGLCACMWLHGGFVHRAGLVSPVLSLTWRSAACTLLWTSSPLSRCLVWICATPDACTNLIRQQPHP